MRNYFTRIISKVNVARSALPTITYIHARFFIPARSSYIRNAKYVNNNIGEQAIEDVWRSSYCLPNSNGTSISIQHFDDVQQTSV